MSPRSLAPLPWYLTLLHARMDGALLTRFGTSDKLRLADEDVPGMVSAKLDGIHAIASRDGLRSRTGKPITTQQHLNRRLARHFRRHPDQQLHGELYLPGLDFPEIHSAYQTGNRKLRLYVHPGQSDTPLPFFGIRHIRERRAATAQDAARHYAKVVAKGYEGQVIRDAGGGRYKRKPTQDAEFPVADVADTRITIMDGQTARRIKRPGWEVKAGDRVTVRYEGRTKHGAMRFPRAKAVRNSDY